MSEASPPSIEYPSEILRALQQAPDEFAAEARLLLALKLYEMGKLTTGLAARLAGIPRLRFIFLLSEYDLSPFGEDPDDIEQDLADARRACRRE